QLRLFVSTLILLKITELTVAPSCTFMPNPLFEFLMTHPVKFTDRISASVSVPITNGVEEDSRMQLVTVIFSQGLAFFPPREMDFNTMASSPVTITESETTTFLQEQISMPSAFTPFSRSEKI